MPSSSSEEEFDEIRLKPVPGCYEEPPAGFTPFDVECIPIQDFGPGDIQPGGRTLLVTPYVKGIQVCSGQYAQFQVLQGLGGQINNALYVGESIEKLGDGIFGPGYRLTPDCSDVMNGPVEENGGTDGDKGLAIRDRGRWYVVKLAQGVSGSEHLQVEVYGGNKNPYDGDTMDTYSVAPYRPFIFPRFKGDNGGVEFDLTENWYDLDFLPDDFEWGDEFEELTGPDHTLPFGLGWARLARGVTVGQYSWDAATYDHHLTSEDDPDNSPSFTVAFISPDIADDQIIVCYSEAITGFIGIPDPADIAITTTSETELTVLSVTLSARPGDNTFIVQLSRAVVYSEEAVTISVPAEYVEDAEASVSSGGSATVLYKLEKFSFLPVVNMSNDVLLRGQIAFISGTTRDYTIGEDSEAKTVTWYEMFVDGERPKFSMKVLGGNTLDNGVTSYPNAILQLTVFGEPADWQSFNIPDLPSVGSEEELDGGDLPNEVLDGYGWMLGEPVDALFGEASTWQGRMEIAHNRFVGKFVAQDDILLMLGIRVLADSKETPEYRAVWDIFA